MTSIPILNPSVAKAKFARAVEEVKEKQGTYEDVWRLRGVSYPTILVDMMAGPRRPLFTLMLGMENWNFLPPTATLLDLSLHFYLSPGSVPGVAEDLGAPVNHVAGSSDMRGAWFCSPGFYEYHARYPEDRWELIRDTDRGTITEIIVQACNLVDRHRAAEG